MKKINSIYTFSQTIEEFLLMDIYPTLEEAQAVAKKLSESTGKKFYAADQSREDFEESIKNIEKIILEKSLVI